MNISAAGNLVVPAYLTLQAKGYAVACQRADDGSENWVAEATVGRFSADDTISLLGVVTMAETRGTSWPASDEEVEDFLEKFRAPGVD